MTVSRLAESGCSLLVNPRSSAQGPFGLPKRRLSILAGDAMPPPRKMHRILRLAVLGWLIERPSLVPLMCSRHAIQPCLASDKHTAAGLRLVSRPGGRLRMTELGNGREWHRLPEPRPFSASTLAEWSQTELPVQHHSHHRSLPKAPTRQPRANSARRGRQEGGMEWEWEESSGKVASFLDRGRMFDNPTFPGRQRQGVRMPRMPYYW